MENPSNTEKMGMPPAYTTNNDGAGPSTNYGAPVGYPPQQGYGVQQQHTVLNNFGAPPPPMQPTHQVTYVTQQNTGFNSLRAAIPVMPMCVAITLCVVNIFLPGIGTVIASFTAFCCSSNTQTGGDKFGMFCLNFWVGWFQLLTVFVFLIGWVWAIMWGIAFITLAAAPTQVVTTTTTTTTAAVQMPVITIQQQQQY